MKGDFSRWAFDPVANFSGVLYQQGRVRTDVLERDMCSDALAIGDGLVRAERAQLGKGDVNR